RRIVIDSARSNHRAACLVGPHRGPSYAERRTVLPFLAPPPSVALPPGRTTRRRRSQRRKDAIELQQLKDRERLIAKPRDPHFTAVCPNALEKRHDGADAGAVDEAERRQVDDDALPLLGDERVERGAHLRRRNGVEPPFDAEYGFGALIGPREGHFRFASRSSWTAVVRPKRCFFRHSTLGVPASYETSMNERMMKMPMPDSRGERSDGGAMAVGSKL